MNRFKYLLAFIGVSLSAVSCSPDYIKKVLKDNPDILAEVIEENPKLIIDALNKASVKMRQDQLKAAEEDEKKKMEEEFNNPKKPEVTADRAVFGDSSAPITIVEYSDFQCPFCKRASDLAVKQILDEYKGKVRVVYKHLPLPNHPQAEIAAKYYEAVAKVDKKKARAFHDKLFEKQTQIRQGEKFLQGVVKEVGLKVADVKKHLDSVSEIIRKDEQEASRFGFRGTPAFLVGGVSISGAQDVSKFKEVIDRHIKDKNIK